MKRLRLSRLHGQLRGRLARLVRFWPCFWSRSRRRSVVQAEERFKNRLQNVSGDRAGLSLSE